MVPHGRHSPTDWFEIMERLDVGDADAFSEIEALVKNLLRSRRSRSACVAHEDLVQDVLVDLLRAWRSRRIREPARFAGFVRTLTQRRFADALGRERRAWGHDPRVSGSPDPTTSATLERPPSEANLDARRAIAKLDSASLRALEAVYGAGWTYEEAASLLGVPLGTLKRRLAAALRQLREDLAGSDLDLAVHSAEREEAEPEEERLAS